MLRDQTQSFDLLRARPQNFSVLTGETRSSTRR
jgi:hypothetical protein